MKSSEMNEQSVSRFPLEWPPGWKRTMYHARRHPMFKSGGNWIGHRAALDRLELELDRLGAKNVTLSTNLELKFDGTPRGDFKPADPGVAVYFRFKGRATVLACDAYHTVPGNVAVIAAHISSLRAIDRYGVGTIEQALAGYRALPADTAADWRAVMGFGRDERVSVDQLTKRWKERAREVHPDRPGGSEEKMTQLNRAKDYALAELA